MRATGFNSRLAGSEPSASRARVLGFKTAIFVFISVGLVQVRAALHGPLHFLSRPNRKIKFWGCLLQNEPSGRSCLPRVLPADHARDFTGHSAPIFGGPPAERDPNAQHQGGALEARTLKEAGGFGVVRWSRTPCERPDSICGAQRGPSRQQVELEFWGLKFQFSCSSELISFVFAFRCPVRSRFPGEKETEEPIFGFFTPKVMSFDSHSHVPNHRAP